MKKLVIAISVLLIFSSNVYSQDLSDLLSQVNSAYAQKYLEPFTTGLGMNLNSGYMGGFNPGGYSKIPVWPHFYVGVKFCGVVMQSTDKAFDMDYVSNINLYGQTLPIYWKVRNAPTVFGSTTPAVAHGTYSYGGFTRDTAITLIGGVDETSFVPLFIPHFGVGTIFGTDLTIRALPGFEVSNYGSFKLFGLALRHNIGAYAKMPFDISFQLGYQNFSIKDKYYNKFITSNSMFANVQLTKAISIVTLYGGCQYENFTVDVNYYFGNTPVAFTQTGDNTFRGIAGATITLGPFNLNADLSYGAKFAFTGGIGLGM